MSKAKQHPDDIAAEREAVAWAAENIDTWFERHRDEIKQTIQTYADADAEELWLALRERFWLREP